MNNEILQSFFTEEMRCNYYVSPQVKKLWAVELDLLRRFVQVCEKHHLRYFADAGTLLGTIRHQGFIPWDDDVDVCMPREDYNKLFEIAKYEFKEPYFFQTSLTEKCFFRTHAQLRNSLTTGFIPYDQNKAINKGIFLDIFVLDNVADSPILRWFQKNEIRLHELILAYEYDRCLKELSLPKQFFYHLVHLIHKMISFEKHFNYYNHKVLARFSKRETRLIGNLVLGWRTHTQWNRKWFDEFEERQFENLTLRVPKGYHEVLTTQYGDYMRIPNTDEIENGNIHGKLIYDAEIPYKEYMIDS